jgi:hypothetical protein
MNFKINGIWPQNIETGEFVNPDTNVGYLAWLADGNTPYPASTIDPKVVIQSQIEALEFAQLLPRVTREFMLFDSESRFTADQLAENPGYVKLKAFDMQIRALRAQL